MPTESTIASRRLRCSIGESLNGARLGGHRVVAAAAPGMATQEPPHREQRSAPGAVPCDRFGGVVRAARIIATGGPEYRRHEQLIGADHPADRLTQHADRAAVITHLN